MRLTSYKDFESEASPISKLKSNTADGLRTCYTASKKFAISEKIENIPENTRSNPADRIKRLVEGISWKDEEAKQDIIRSPLYKRSVIFFINCVLASLNGESIILKKHTVNNLLSEKSYKGRKFFLEELKKALYGYENSPIGIPMSRDEIVFIYHNNDLIGLLSAAGPIPTVDNTFCFKELPIDETAGSETIINALNEQDRQVLKFWLNANKNIINKCNLYSEIFSHIENLEVDAVIERTMEVNEFSNSVYEFPAIKDYKNKILSDTITIVPIEDENSCFGYNMNPLKIEINNLWYAFIPPLTQSVIEWTKNEDFKIKSIDIDNPSIEGELTSIRVFSNIEIDTLNLAVSKTYKKGQIRYVKKFPTMSVYGPSPKAGWIALRNLAPTNPPPSPLANNSQAMIDGLKDMEFVCYENGSADKLEFEVVEENFSIYQGIIPKWLGINGNGNWLGGIPLRVVDNDLQSNWSEAPAFIHNNLPQSNEKLKVAVDIGSSRSVVLFWKDLSNENTISDTLIDENQNLGVRITKPFESSRDEQESSFENISFQSEKWTNKPIKGKTPFGIVPTPLLSNEDVLLYKSGKLILLDPKTVSDVASTSGDNRRIISDIKTNLKEKNNEMLLLVQGILTMIVERAIHMGCSHIDIRTSYLTEQYTRMKKIWMEAKQTIEEIMPDDSKVHIDINLCLPESLAIANAMSHANKFLSGSGAAFIDIGDLSTDIALFRNKISKNLTNTNTDVELVTNCSVRFAGNKILLKPIWDYLKFSKIKAEYLFDVSKDENAKKIIKNIEEQRKQNVDIDDARNNLLCLMNIFVKKNIPVELQNLFDIGYLAEVLILKTLLKTELSTKGSGTFNIHLFGGGSSYFKPESEGFNWSTVLDRPCKTYDASDKGNILASGLFRGALDELHENIAEAAKNEKVNAESHGTKNQNNNAQNEQAIPEPKEEELKKSYAVFINEAENLKKLWKFQDVVGRNQNTYRVFNLNKVTEESEANILDERLWTMNYDKAMQFARKSMTDSMEIFKILFDYKMAYCNIIAFYKGGMIKY